MQVAASADSASSAGSADSVSSPASENSPDDPGSANTPGTPDSGSSPERVMVLGGTAAVSDEVATQLGASRSATP